MTPEQARQILGLSPGEDWQGRIDDFRAARDRIAELVRTAPTDALAVRYQDGLMEFNRALAVLREESEKEPPEQIRRREWMAAACGVSAEELQTPDIPSPRKTAPIEKRELSAEPEPGSAAKPEVPAAAPPAAPPDEDQEEEDADESDAPPRKKRRGPVLVTLLLLAAAGGFAAYKYDEHQKLRLTDRIAFLERLGARMIEGRRWPEAAAAYNEIHFLRPGSRIVEVGRRSIEAGMEEEQRQFVGYWSGEALAAFELGRMDDAIASASKVLEKYPNQQDMADLMRRAEEARSTQMRDRLVSAAGTALQRRQWDEAETHARELATAFPGDPMSNSLLSEVRVGREREIKERARARQLFEAAKLKDGGAFDQEAFDWLREAMALAPDDEEIAALHEKIGSYTRTIEVPGDYATVAEAVAAARDRDRITVAEGTFTGPVVIDKVITLEGAGRDKTFIQVEAASSCAVTFGRNASGSRASGLTFRHLGFEAGENRFSAVLVRGSEVNFSDCRAADAAGHGLAVIDSARVTATRCVFENNGWDGVAVRGAGSRIEATECESLGNIGHGFDVWEGGSAAIHGSLARDNSGAGIVIATDADHIVAGNNDLRGNREFGLVVISAKGGRIHDNRCHENLLGGMAVRQAAGALTYDGNRLEKNLGPGLALERGLTASAFSRNTASGNAERDIVPDSDF